MKKIIPWAVFLLIVKNSPGQNGCFNNINTRSTDPTEVFAADGKNPNAIYITGPNNSQISNPNHFDWTDPTASHLWYWSANTTVNPAVIHLPYYCDLQGVSNINGACTNQNIYYYQQLINNFSQGISVHDQNKLFDILPEDGWELVFKNFGTAGTNQNVAAHQPTFILYNKYTGKLKVFAAATGLQQGLSNLTNINRAALRVSFPNNDKTALLGMAQPISQVMKSYTTNPAQGSTDHFMNNEFCTPNVISHLDGSVGNTPPEYQWLSSEFLVPYDPCTCFSPNIPQMKISIVYWSNSSVDMGGLITGKLNATPTDFYSGNNLDQNNKGASVATKGNVVNGIEGALKAYETWSGYSAKVKKMFESKSGGQSGSIGTDNIEINTIVNTWYDETGLTGSTSQQQKNTLYYNMVLGGTSGKADEGVKEASGFNDAITAAASMYPYFAAFYGFANAMAAGGQENTVDNRAHVLIDNPSPPVSYIVDQAVKLTGQISTQTEPTPIFPYVSGSRTSYNITGPAPMYNNVLGVFNIVEQPTFDRTPLQITNSFQLVKNTDYPNWWQCNANPPTTNADFNAVTTPVLHYKINQDVKYLLNPNANVDVLGIDAAIVVEYGSTEDFIVANSGVLLAKPLIPFYSQVGQTNTTLQNRIDFISAQSGLILESISEDFPAEASSIIRFRTPYVPLECLNSLNFLLYGNIATTNAPKTYLKLVCKFKRQNSSTADPIVHVQTFDISDAIKNPTTKSQINNAGTLNLSNTPVFSEICHDSQHAAPCLIWSDGNGQHNCYQSFNVVHGAATLNSFNLTQFAYQNPFIANNQIASNSINLSNSNMVISGDVSIGTKNLANGDISFQGQNLHVIGTVANPGPNGNVAELLAKHDVIFNGKFSFINKTDVRAGHEITFPSGSEVEINADGQFTIDHNGSIVSMLMGCTSPLPITYLEANTNDANALCNGGALRLGSSPDSTQTRTDTLATTQAENAAKNTNLEQRVVQDFNVMPNPTEGYVRVLLTNATELPASVSIENILGNRIYEIKAPRSYEIDFNISDIPKGVYIIRVDLKDGGVATKRLIKN